MKEKIGTLYLISNDINDKLYIGKTYKTLKQRWKMHVSDSKKDNKNRHLYNAMKKYGIEHFQIKEIGRYEVGKLEEMEKYYIQKYDTYNNGYNCTLGGDGHLVSSKYNTEQKEFIIQCFYKYPNVSFLSKVLKVNHKVIDEILNEHGITKLQQPQLKTIENIKLIYQIKDDVIVNVFYSYDEVKHYLISKQIIKANMTTDSVRIQINSYINKKWHGYNWKIVHLKDVIEDGIKTSIINSNLFEI